jgi:hypothetical protein
LLVLLSSEAPGGPYSSSEGAHGAASSGSTLRLPSSKGRSDPGSNGGGKDESELEYKSESDSSCDV